MIVYNIRKAQYSNSLKASGIANRWNKEEEYVIYTGESIALSTLELIAHRNSIELKFAYKVLSIRIDSTDILEINSADLPKNWLSIASYPSLQEIGSSWYKSKKSLILKVPSVLVQKESNFLINTTHPEFLSKVSIESSEDFFWDSRLV